MCKLKKILILLLLAVVIAFGVSGCNTGTNELQDKIDGLQSQLEELNGRLSEMEEENKELNFKLDELEKELAELSQNKNQLAPPFYALETAYDNGWLLQEDLQTIANYHHNNNVKYPESLNEDIAKSIKKDWAEKLMNDKPDSSEKLTDEDVYILQYYGTYNGCVAVILDRIDAIYPQIYAPITIEIGNVQFTFQAYQPTIIIWKK